MNLSVEELLRRILTGKALPLSDIREKVVQLGTILEQDVREMKGLTRPKLIKRFIAFVVDNYDELSEYYVAKKPPKRISLYVIIRLSL